MNILPVPRSRAKCLVAAGAPGQTTRAVALLEIIHDERDPGLDISGARSRAVTASWVCAQIFLKRRPRLLRETQVAQGLLDL